MLDHGISLWKGDASCAFDPLRYAQLGPQQFRKAACGRLDLPPDVLRLPLYRGIPYAVRLAAGALLRTEDDKVPIPDEADFYLAAVQGGEGAFLRRFLFPSGRYSASARHGELLAGESDFKMTFNPPIFCEAGSHIAIELEHVAADPAENASFLFEGTLMYYAQACAPQGAAR